MEVRVRVGDRAPGTVSRIAAVGPPAQADGVVTAEDFHTLSMRAEQLLSSGNPDRAIALLPDCAARADHEGKPLQAAFARTAARVISCATGKAASWHAEAAIHSLARSDMLTLGECTTACRALISGRFLLGPGDRARVAPEVLEFALTAAKRVGDARAVREVERLQSLCRPPEGGPCAGDVAGGIDEGLSFLSSAQRSRGDVDAAFAGKVMSGLTGSSRESFAKATLADLKAAARAGGDMHRLDALELLSGVALSEKSGQVECLRYGFNWLAMNGVERYADVAAFAADLAGRAATDDDATRIARSISEALAGCARRRNHAGRLAGAQALGELATLSWDAPSTRIAVMAAAFRDATAPSTPDRAWPALAVATLVAARGALSAADCSRLMETAFHQAAPPQDPLRQSWVDGVRAMAGVSVQHRLPVQEAALRAWAAEGGSDPGDFATAALRIVDASDRDEDREALGQSALKQILEVARAAGDTQFTAPLVMDADRRMAQTSVSDRRRVIRETLNQLCSLRGESFRQALRGNAASSTPTIEATDTELRIGTLSIPRNRQT